MNARSCLTLVLSLGILFSLSLATEKPDKKLEPALKSIQGMDAYNFVKTLASREFRGRLTGDEGYTAAAKWAANKFKAWGLRPVSTKEGFLLAYPSPFTLIDRSEMALLLPKENANPQNLGADSFEEIKLEPEKDYLPLLFSDNGRATAELVFAGWGISAPDLSYDDYAGLAVKGKFVLCFRGTPDEAEKRFQYHDEHRTRMKLAHDRGALGLLYVYDEPLSNPNGDWIQGFTPGMISAGVFDRILKEKGTSSTDLKKALLTFKRPISFPLRSKMNFSVESRHFPQGIGYNVAAYVEGSDPVLRKDCLVIGGHFDHNGLQQGLLFPGADDNASGSAVVMEIAEAFSRLDRQPKRSVVFVLFGGEEMGLQGSTYFSEHVPAQFQRVDAMFNFDMNGEGDGTAAICSVKAPELKKVLEEADKSVKTLRQTGEIRDIGVRSSDFAPFFLKGANCVAFFSNGPHLAYHKTGDTIYRINPDIMADIARLAFLSAHAWTDR